MVQVREAKLEGTGTRAPVQWRDVLGVLAVRGVDLDEDYLRRWSRDLGVEDLLDRALAEDAAAR